MRAVPFTLSNPRISLNNNSSCHLMQTNEEREKKNFFYNVRGLSGQREILGGFETPFPLGVLSDARAAAMVPPDAPG